MNEQLVRFPSKQKALDYALWQNFISAHSSKPKVGVVYSAEGDHIVLPTIHPSISNDEFEELPESLSQMSYEHIRMILMEEEPLPFWRELESMFNSVSSDLLRFLIQMEVPFLKFILYELANRGIDHDGEWCGTKKAREIWLT